MSQTTRRAAPHSWTDRPSCADDGRSQRARAAAGAGARRPRHMCVDANGLGALDVLHAPQGPERQRGARLRDRIDAAHPRPADGPGRGGARPGRRSSASGCARSRALRARFAQLGARRPRARRRRALGRPRRCARRAHCRRELRPGGGSAAGANRGRATRRRNGPGRVGRRGRPAADVRSARGFASMASSLFISERQLRRRFEAATGLAPTTLHRILRFQRFLALAWTCERPSTQVTRLAVEAGFVDHAHLSREAARLEGRSPRAFLSESELRCGCGHDHGAPRTAAPRPPVAQGRPAKPVVEVPPADLTLSPPPRAPFVIGRGIAALRARPPRRGGGRNGVASFSSVRSRSARAACSAPRAR